MKKALLVVLFAVLSAGVVSAQEPVSESSQEVAKIRKETKLRKKYFNLNYSFQGLYPPGSRDDKQKSKWGAGFSTGQTFVLHKNPIAGMLHVGLDATWFDLNAAQYDDILGAKQFQLEAAMGLGVGIHLTPIGKLGIHTYARYNPTFSAIALIGDELAYGLGYASGVVSGLAVSWGVISLGFEGRWLFSNYSMKLFDAESDDMSSAKQKLNTSGCRVYLGFRW